MRWFAGNMKCDAPWLCFWRDLFFNRSRPWEDWFPDSRVLIGRNRNDYENQMLCLGFASDTGLQGWQISFLACLPALIKGPLSGGAHNCWVPRSFACSYHRGFYTTWYFCWQFEFITSEIVRVEIQDVSSIYFYLKLLGGFVRQYLVSWHGQEALQSFPLIFRDMFVLHIHLSLLLL